MTGIRRFPLSRLLDLSYQLAPPQASAPPAAGTSSRLLLLTRVPLLSTLLHDDSGQDLIEYALVAALVGLAAVSAMHGLSTKISTAFNSVGNSLTSSV